MVRSNNTEPQVSMANTESQALPQGIGVLSSGEGHAAAVYEETHVHGVYEAIAPHFSATRHKPWPFVSSFLASQPPGSVGLDVGCGNGKNMGVNQDVVMLGCDRSAALVALARDMWCTGRASNNDGHGAIAGADVAVADGLCLPFREASADFVICIAVIHHLSTRERRVDAIRRLLRCTRRNKNNKANGRSSTEAYSPLDADKLGGGVLVYVWALEQSSSRRGWDKDSEQDLLVPWVMKAPQQKKIKTSQPPKTRKKKQEMPATAAHQVPATACRDRNGAGEGRDPSSGEGGEYMQGRRQQSHGTHGEEGRTTAAADADANEDADPPAAMSQPSGKQSTGDNAEETGGETSSDGHQQPQPQQVTEEDKTFHRFYHLYKEGELEEDILAAGGQVLRSGYERDNWWVIAC